jgi:hypothetical protein
MKIFIIFIITQTANRRLHLHIHYDLNISNREGKIAKGNSKTMIFCLLPHSDAGASLPNMILSFLRSQRLATKEVGIIIHKYYLIHGIIPF